MQHLDPERIASFDHDPPTAGELAHLDACATCRDEQRAMQELSQMALHVVYAEASLPTTPLTSWETLSVHLREEGLISGGGSRQVSGTRTPAVRNRTEWWRFAAAALMLVAGGSALGRMSAGVSPARGTGAYAGTSSASVLGSLSGLGSTGFSSVGEATRMLNSAQREYEHASLWLAANDTVRQSSELVRLRLAALDQMVAASRSGLAASPNDPVLNHYYYAARAMREATLQQLGGALPVGRSIERF